MAQIFVVTFIPDAPELCDFHILCGIEFLHHKKLLSAMERGATSDESFIRPEEQAIAPPRIVLNPTRRDVLKAMK